ncbi:MAG TPA: hypothetical protein VGF93_10890 [Solirubrobacteraceae bacterium]
MNARAFVFACAAAATLALLTGCAPIAPPVAQTQTTNEVPSPAPPQAAVAAAPTAVAAVRRFADAYINWTAQTVATDMRSLADESVGQARSAMQLAAAQTAGDYELKRGGIANRGSVEAVSLLPGERTRYVVVTRETTTATSTGAYQGLAPAWHVAIATVVQTPAGRWALNGWHPES